MNINPKDRAVFTSIWQECQEEAKRLFMEAGTAYRLQELHSIGCISLTAEDDGEFNPLKVIAEYQTLLAFEEMGFASEQQDTESDLNWLT